MHNILFSRFIVGARIYRETPSINGAQCIWKALTTTLQDLKNLISERIEINPDRSEEECLLYNRISKDLISDIEVGFDSILVKIFPIELCII